MPPAMPLPGSAAASPWGSRPHAHTVALLWFCAGTKWPLAAGTTVGMSTATCPGTRKDGRGRSNTRVPSAENRLGIPELLLGCSLALPLALCSDKEYPGEDVVSPHVHPRSSWKFCLFNALLLLGATEVKVKASSSCTPALPPPRPRVSAEAERRTQSDQLTNHPQKVAEGGWFRSQSGGTSRELRRRKLLNAERCC